MKKILVIIMFVLHLIAGCSTKEELIIVARHSNSLNTQIHQETETNLENLGVFWSIRKPENVFYIKEGPRNIVKVKNDEIQHHSVILEKEFATTSETSLLGFVLAPSDEESELAYAYYAYEDISGHFNRIVTLRSEHNIWKEDRLLIDKIPRGSFIIMDEALKLDLHENLLQQQPVIHLNRVWHKIPIYEQDQANEYLLI
ncbi:hypothetical protein [Halalkalibacter alkalisediminis]|uniref:Lipoprotein n=1 Tax=Halalkalibacter alkalisediminis TaxID=935616 RepID=A0ABV6NLB8_9BACI|nr:hypothetical protein [Halalkalibacter alkalisediminis]